jgi:hypothetical protein
MTNRTFLFREGIDLYNIGTAGGQTKASRWLHISIHTEASRNDRGSFSKK